MKCTSFALAAALLLPAVPAAQDGSESPFPMGPADEVARFEQTIGSWKGTGQAWMEPGGEAFPWSGDVKTQWVMGGHFVQIDEAFETGMGPFVMHYVMGWDAMTQRYVAHGFTNMGNAGYDVAWVDDDTLSMIISSTMEGQPVVERLLFDYAGDSYEFSLDKSTNGGPFFRSVEGTFRRVEEDFDAAAIEASAPEMPLAPEHQAIDSLRGRYELAGSMTMAPGMPSMDITGVEDVDWILGGSAMTFEVAGQPMNYEGRGYLYWDAEAGVYRHLGINNMGAWGTMDVYLVDRSLVHFTTNVEMDMAGATRVVATMDEDGHLATVTVDRMPSLGDTYRTFSATYTHQGAAGDETSAFTPGSCCARAAAAGKACTHPCCVSASEKGEVCSGCNK